MPDANKPTARLSPQDWSRYWRKSTITTFSRQFDTNYDQQFLDFWSANLARVRQHGHIVDLATGNGAVALIAARYSRDNARALVIDGIDYADIHPAEDLADKPDVAALLSDIRFAGGINIEATGLADGCADLVTSQYGFEYANARPAAAEAARITRPGGHIALVLHHSESFVLRQARDSVAQMRLLMHREKFADKVTALVREMGDAHGQNARQRLRHNPRAESLRKKLNATIQRINNRAPRFEDPEGFIGIVIPNFMNVFSHYRDHSLHDRLAYIAGLRGELTAFQARMADLASAALTPAQFEQLARHLGDAGFAGIDTGELRYGPASHLMGWTLTATRA